MAKKTYRPDTEVVHAGQDRKRNAGIVNTPVYHASTVVFESHAHLQDAVDRAMRKREKHLFYGRRGTPTHWTLQEAVTRLEGAADTFLTPSGLSACTLSIIACIKSGDHALVVDSAYEPTQVFCEHLLKNFGVEVGYFDPATGGEIGALMRPNTSVVFCESPGSHTFEVQDLPAIAAAVHAKNPNCRVIVDNTWASPLYCQPIKLGCDISIQAATKYVVGHSDAMMGTISCNEATTPIVAKALGAIGNAVGPDDAYLATRGLRTLSVRLKQHERSALVVAKWLEQRPEVKRVLYPPLPSDPGHALWKRDFSGASGLMGVVFKRTSQAAAVAMLDSLKLFPLGFSWGGFESLACLSEPQRVAKPWAEPVPGIRLHIGLEDPSDLIADLEQGLAVFNRALG